MDATHLCKFCQVEGLVTDYDLSLEIWLKDQKPVSVFNQYRTQNPMKIIWYHPNWRHGRRFATQTCFVQRCWPQLLDSLEHQVMEYEKTHNDQVQDRQLDHCVVLASHNEEHPIRRFEVREDAALYSEKRNCSSDVNKVHTPPADFPIKEITMTSSRPSKSK